MKYLMSILGWAMSASMLFMVACGGEDKPENDAPATELELNLIVGEVTPSTIDFTITPNLDGATYYAKVCLAEELSSERDIAKEAALLVIDQMPSVGVKSFQAADLKANKEYQILYFGYNADEKRYTTHYFVSEVVKTSVAEITGALELDVVAGSETWRDAMVKIVPSSSDLEYVFGFMPKAEWTQKYAINPNLIIQDRIDGWLYDVECGIDYLPELDTWQKYMYLCQNSGSQTISVAEYYNLRWAEEYVVYTFGMNDDGDTTANVVVEEFATTTPVASTNQFSIEIGELTASSVAFTVTTTNNDPYFLTIQDKRYLERFGDGMPESWEDMIFDLTFSKTDMQLSNNIFTGTQAFTNASISKNIDTFHEYQIVVWGFNNGPTTEVYLSDVFRPADAE
jgi:hypothetical protein